MDEELTPEILLDYHFGTLEARERTVVEERLVASQTALRAYLELKRALDGAAGAQAQDDRPSPEAAARLRAAVAAAHGPGVMGRLRRWLRRPVPLYQSVAFAAATAVLVAAIALFRPATGHQLPAAQIPAPAVDSVRAPLSLQVL
jgi:anti-sigma-K factor RskA